MKLKELELMSDTWLVKLGLLTMMRQTQLAEPEKNEHDVLTLLSQTLNLNLVSCIWSVNPGKLNLMSPTS